MGLKALAIYHNNNKVGQPLQDKKGYEAAATEDVLVATRPIRKRLPESRTGRATWASRAVWYH